MNPPSIKKTAQVQEKLAESVTRYAEENHLSLRKLSRMMHKSDSFLQKICSQERFPTQENLLLICRTIDLPLTELDPDYVMFSSVHRKAFDLVASLPEERLKRYLHIIEEFEAMESD